ncbi:hypothetical protein SAMN02982929_05322 [Saccharopolyspora kobensis]|uniref:Uncharacterized protein n=1 Tax=Saccharopolyspora kobensis TaxID=146035 RepID=A0A1H6E1M5_9PSEU|nr:hypothetical protein [Saccharopolyspora kobensis]SEG90835.1 hypothetical protein SAMN02982929_05322 [Saccharopolyspora kobensis]SFD94133.1 hypothetical protein SAMN05216506_107298 [Saccharopolyspora kobensis]
MTTTAAARGRSNRRKGIETERRVARYLNEHGWPKADRYVNNGYRTATRTAADPLDIRETPGLVWSVKYDASHRIAAWFAEVEDKAAAVGADLGVLVERRPGYANPGRWWAYITVADLHGLFAAAHGGTAQLYTSDAARALVCLELGALVLLLRAAGYGTTPAQENSPR